MSNIEPLIPRSLSLELVSEIGETTAGSNLAVVPMACDRGLADSESADRDVRP